MRREIQQMIEKLYKQYVKRKRWHKVVMALAAVVVFCTTYAMVLPAITLETKCGMEEHIHVETCYEKVFPETTKSLACTYESLGVHIHTPECYDSESNLLCGMGYVKYWPLFDLWKELYDCRWKNLQYSADFDSTSCDRCGWNFVLRGKSRI